MATGATEARRAAATAADRRARPPRALPGVHSSDYCTGSTFTMDGALARNLGRGA